VSQAVTTGDGNNPAQAGSPAKVQGKRKKAREDSAVRRIEITGCLILMGLAARAARRTGSAAGRGCRAAVQTAVGNGAGGTEHEYVATSSRGGRPQFCRQVSGMLTQILVRRRSRKSRQTLMTIDPRSSRLRWRSTGHERQKKALYDYNTIEVERQRKLFEAGVTSRDTSEQAQQAFQNSKADYESAVEARKTQEHSWRTTRSGLHCRRGGATFRCMWATTPLLRVRR